MIAFRTRLFVIMTSFDQRPTGDTIVMNDLGCWLFPMAIILYYSFFE